MESTLVTDVADDPSSDIDWSFVDTGVTSWTWLTEGWSGQGNGEVVRKYVDLAYEMGWSYYIMDEGWQPYSTEPGKRYGGYFDWFDEMVEYAEERGVGLVAWILAHDLDTPEELALPSYIKRDVMEKNGMSYTQTTDLEAVMPELDVLYMTRVQKERFFNEEDYLRLKDSYILTNQKLKNAKSDLCIMHPLPRVNEISVAIDEDPRACYFKQVLNGKHVRKALIVKLLKEAGTI